MFRALLSSAGNTRKGLQGNPVEFLCRPLFSQMFLYLTRAGEPIYLTPGAMCVCVCVCVFKVVIFFDTTKRSALKDAEK